MRTYSIIFLLLFSLLGIGIIAAQEEVDTCPLLVETALTAVGENCGDLSRNSACYGFNQVEATFGVDVSDDFFSVPSDRAELTNLQTLHTSSLDAENDIWGIAMMNVQANVPNTLPGQAVVFILIGDAEIENVVAPDNAFLPADPIPVTIAASAANIRNAPSADAFVLGSVPINTALEADGRSADGEWLRILFDDSPAWVNRVVLHTRDGLVDLPVISAENLTPMQAFYFNTGVGDSFCNEAPNSIMIQGPDSVEVAINANGADIHIGSTILLQQPAEDKIQLTALQGHAKIGGLTIPGGFTVSANLDEQGNIQPDTIGGFRPLSQEEIGTFQSLQHISGSVLNYQIQVPTIVEIARTQEDFARANVRVEVAKRCMEAGLSSDQCQQFISGQTDRVVMYQRCLDAGYSQNACRQIVADGSFSYLERCRLAGYDTPEACRAAFPDGIPDNDGGTLTETCRAAGFGNLEACRAAFPGDSDDLIALCQAAGHTNGATCRAAFSGVDIDRIRDCISRGFPTVEACRQGNNADNNDGGGTSQATNACIAAGNTPKQCLIMKLVQICTNRGYTPAQCAAYIQANS